MNKCKRHYELSILGHSSRGSASHHQRCHAGPLLVPQSGRLDTTKTPLQQAPIMSRGRCLGSVNARPRLQRDRELKDQDLHSIYHPASAEPPKEQIQPTSHGRRPSPSQSGGGGEGRGLVYDLGWITGPVYSWASNGEEGPSIRRVEGARAGMADFAIFPLSVCWHVGKPTQRTAAACLRGAALVYAAEL